MAIGDFDVSDTDNAVAVRQAGTSGSTFALADGVVRTNTQAKGVLLVCHRQV